MALPNAIMNTEGVLIERPINPQAGNDANKRVLYEGLRAHVSSREVFVRPVGSSTAERVMITEVRIHAHDRNAVPIDVQSGDFVTYPDFRGLVQRLRLTEVAPAYVLGKLDQLLLTGNLS